jgi:hypothetical protein
MDRNQALHYHIRWSGRTELDWECFDTSADAESNARKLVQMKETYTIEEHDGTCPRCQDAMKTKTAPSAPTGA